jgi:translation initiation factor IF-3
MAQQQRRPFQRPVRQEEPYRINERIRVPQVRLVGEGIEQGIYEIAQALQMAQAQSLDLVEISPNAVPPVCKIIDYSKFK